MRPVEPSFHGFCSLSSSCSVINGFPLFGPSFRYDRPFSKISLMAAEASRSRIAPPITGSGNTPYQSSAGRLDVIIIEPVPRHSFTFANHFGNIPAADYSLTCLFCATRKVAPFIRRLICIHPAGSRTRSHPTYNRRQRLSSDKLTRWPTVFFPSSNSLLMN